MKLLKGKQQVKPVSTGVDTKPMIVDYNNYDISTTPLLNEEGDRVFFVDNPLTRTERNTHNISIEGANYAQYKDMLESTRKWLYENPTAITAKFMDIHLPIEDVINKVSLKGLYRMAPRQVDNVLDLTRAENRQAFAEERQFIKSRDIYEGVTPYAFQNAVVGYYHGEQYELLEQKVEEVIKEGKYPDTWHPIDIRCTRTSKLREPVRARLNERYIHTYDGDVHYLNLCASLMAGLETVRVEIYYHGGCEKNSTGIWSPNAILNMYAKHLMEVQAMGGLS